MRISNEWALKLNEDNKQLRKLVKDLREQNAFIKKCLYYALKRSRFVLVMDDETEQTQDLEFDLDETDRHYLVVKVRK